MKRLILAAALMLVVPLGLQAQESTTEARIGAALETAMSQGIPVDLLQSKVTEGRAKGVNEARIAAAVEARLQGLQRAAEALQRAQVESSTAADLSVSADALEAGVSEDALIKVSEHAPAERRAVAIATLSGLVQLGVAPDAALARVSAVVRSSAELGRLNADVATTLQARGSGGLIGAGASAGVRN